MFSSQSEIIERSMSFFQEALSLKAHAEKGHSALFLLVYESPDFAVFVVHFIIRDKRSVELLL